MALEADVATALTDLKHIRDSALSPVTTVEQWDAMFKVHLPVLPSVE